MSEQIPTSPENKKKPSEISRKTKKLIQAFSLSVWLAIWWNAHAGEAKTHKIETSPVQTQLNIEDKQNIYNELRYLFVEKQDGFMQSILQKAKDEWIYYDNLSNDLEYFENLLILTFEPAIKKNGLELEYTLEPELIELMRSMKTTFDILLNLRYGKWVYNLFNWKDYSDYRLKIIFQKNDNWYKIESIYIISPEQNLDQEILEWKESFYQNIV